MLAAEAWVAIRAQQSNLAQDLSGMKSLVLGAVGGIVGAAGAMAGGLGAGLFGGFVQKAAEAEVNALRFKSAIEASGANAGFTAGQFEQMANTIRDTSTFGLAAARSAEAMLLRFGEIRGENFARTLNAAKDLAAYMGMEMPDAARVLGHALENPESGFRRLEMTAGVSFSKIEKGMIKAAVGEGPAGMVRAQGMILDAINKSAVGGFAEKYRGTFTGQIDLMGNEIKGMQKTIGAAMMPAFTAMMPAVKDLAQAVVENKDIFADLGNTIGGVLGAAAQAITGMIGLWRDLDPGVKTVVKGITMAAGAALALSAGFGPIAAVVGTVAGVLGGLLTPLGAVAGLVALIGAAFATAFKDPELGPRMRAALGSIWDVIKSIGSILASVGEGIMNTVGPAFRALQETAVGALEGIARFVTDNRADFELWAGLIRQSVAQAFAILAAMAEIAWDKIKKFWAWVSGNTPNVWDTIKNKITDTLAIIATAMKQPELAWEIVCAEMKLATTKATTFIQDAWHGLSAETSGYAAEAAAQMKKAFSGDWQTRPGEMARLHQQAYDEYVTTHRIGGDTTDAEAKLSQLKDEFRRFKQEVKDEASKPPAKPKLRIGEAYAEEYGGASTATLPEGKIKFEFTGFADLAKDIQKSLTGGDMEALQKRMADSADMTKDHTKRTADAAEETARLLRENANKPARAG